MGRAPLILVALASAGIVVGGFVAFSSGFFVREEWTRNEPLQAPIACGSVTDGTIMLADGRRFAPAGVKRKASVSQSDFDTALRIACAQGVEVTRDLGDGRAFLLADPKFWNWCGTHDGWRHWAGGTVSCPLSEFLVLAGYAEFDDRQEGLTDRERCRFVMLLDMWYPTECPLSLSAPRGMFCFESRVTSLRYLDISSDHNDGVSPCGAAPAGSAK